VLLSGFSYQRHQMCATKATPIDVAASLLHWVLQDPLGIGRNSNDNANARSMAMAYNSLAKVLAALRHSAPAAAGGAAAAASAASALANNGLAAGQQQHVPWRDSPLTRWLQERLHAATAITMLGTVSASTEVGGCAASN
jgi:kinesin family protein 4/21/27